MPKIPIENQDNKEEKEFSRKEIITPEKTEALEKLYQNKEFARIQKPPKVPVKIIIISIVISVIFGILAGFFGALFLLTRKEIKIPFLKKINFEEVLPKREITLFTEKKITVIPEERVLTVVERVSSQTVKIFFSKKIKSNEIFERFFLPTESLGLGVVLTSDGWIITTKEIVNRKNLNLEVLTFAKKKFPVKKIVFDDLSGVAFLKIETKDLPVIKFSEEGSVFFGKNLLVFNKSSDLELPQISQPRFSQVKEKRDFIKSTESFSNFIRINKELSENFLAAPVFDLESSFLGFVSRSKNLIIPITHFKAVIDQVLKKDKVSRPFMGVEYLDLKDISEPPSFLENIKSGAVVYNLKEKSPAFLAGLKKDDVILKINEISLDSQRDLTEIIQKYNPGQEIEFLILREEKEMMIKVKLGTLP